MKSCAIVCLCLILVALGGCNYFAWFAYVVAPEAPGKNIEPEYKDLPGKTVAVVVFAEPKVLYEYHYLREEIAGAVGDELTRNVDKVKMVAPSQVCAYQDQNPDWDNMGKAELAKKLGADFVMYVSLEEFTTLEPGSAYLHRGHIGAQVMLYKASLPEAQSRVWPEASAGEIRLAYPEDDAIGKIIDDDRQLRHDTIHQFADVLAKKFYKHKAPAEEKGKSPDKEIK